jgi:hypothetical protein
LPLQKIGGRLVDRLIGGRARECEKYRENEVLGEIIEDELEGTIERGLSFHDNEARNG